MPEQPLLMPGFAPPPPPDPLAGRSVHSLLQGAAGALPGNPDTAERLLDAAARLPEARLPDYRRRGAVLRQRVAEARMPAG